MIFDCLWFLTFKKQLKLQIMKISKFEQVETKNLVVFFLKKTKKGVLSAPLYTTYEHLASFNNRMVPILRVFSFFILHIFRHITIPTSDVCSSFNFIFFSHVLTCIFVLFNSFFLFFFRQVAIFASCLCA